MNFHRDGAGVIKIDGGFFAGIDDSGFIGVSWCLAGAKLYMNYGDMDRAAEKIAEKIADKGVVISKLVFEVGIYEVVSWGSN